MASSPQSPSSQLLTPRPLSSLSLLYPTSGRSPLGPIACLWRLAQVPHHPQLMSPSPCAMSTLLLENCCKASYCWLSLIMLLVVNMDQVPYWHSYLSCVLNCSSCSYICTQICTCSLVITPLWDRTTWLAIRQTQVTCTWGESTYWLYWWLMISHFRKKVDF